MFNKLVINVINNMYLTHLLSQTKIVIHARNNFSAIHNAAFLKYNLYYLHTTFHITCFLSAKTSFMYYAITSLMQFNASHVITLLLYILIFDKSNVDFETSWLIKIKSNRRT